MAPRTRGRGEVALLGAGNFARATLLPALDDAGLHVAVVASAGGVSAERLATRLGAVQVTPDDAVGGDAPDIAVIATPHDTHARLAVQALAAGKHVFCEKPLSLVLDECLAVEAEAARHPHLKVMIGFVRNARGGS